MPKSGLFFDMLEGISLKSVSDVVTAKYGGKPENLAQMAIFYAYSKVKQLVKSKMNAKGIKLGHTIEKINCCDFKNEVAQPSWSIRGIRISKSFIQSPFSKLHLDTVKIKTQNSSNTVFQVKDNIGNVLFSKDVKTVQNEEIRIDINKSFSPNVLILGFDQSNLIPYLSNCNRQTCCNSCIGNEDKLVVVDGWNGERVSPNGYGVTACIKVVCCEDDKFWCDVICNFHWPILYLAGVFILEEAKATDRINQFAVHGQEWISEKISEWYGESNGYIETDIDSVLIKIKSDDYYCFPCNNKLSYINSTS